MLLYSPRSCRFGCIGIRNQRTIFQNGVSEGKISHAQFRENNRDEGLQFEDKICEKFARAQYFFIVQGKPSHCIFLQGFRCCCSVLNSLFGRFQVKKLDFIFQTASSLTSKEVTSSESYLQETVERYFESEEEYTQCKVPDIVKHNRCFVAQQKI